MSIMEVTNRENKKKLIENWIEEVREACEIANK